VCEYGSVNVTDLIQRMVDGPGEGKKLYIPSSTDICEFLGIKNEPEEVRSEVKKKRERGCKSVVSNRVY
jgi:hypothetical protein